MPRGRAGFIERRIASWLDATGDLLSEPLTTFPAARIHEVFLATFEIEAVAFGWMESDGKINFLTTPCVEAMRRSEFMDEMPWVFSDHPLHRWFGQSADPQSLGRVPREFCAPGARAKVRHLMRDTPCTEQLAIPLGKLGDFRMIGLGRTGRDFSDDDMALARRLKPVLRGLDVQCQVARRRKPFDAAIQGSASSPLSPRQLAVLGLVGDGLVAGAIGRRLGISARTVEKHLEQAYRKLGVHDRVSAIRLCTDLAGNSEPRLPT